MPEGLKNLITVLGLIGVLSAGLVIYDRYNQHPKPNVAIFEGRVDGKKTSREIISRHESSQKLYEFLRSSEGKRIYVDIDFLVGDGPWDIKMRPAGIPSSSQPVEITFWADCAKYPVPIEHPIRQGKCEEVTIYIEPTRNEVERQVFGITAAMFELRGYFINVSIEGRMGFYRVTLKPLSANQVLT
jgi:hypothetical protein